VWNVGHPDRKTQERMVREITADVEESKAGFSVVLSFDPTHPTHNNINGYLWQEKGGKNTKRALSNTGRRRITVLGAVNLLSKNPVCLVTESNCDTNLILAFLDEVKKEYRGISKIIIYLDNAKYQRNYVVMDYAKKLGITLKFLPPYAPNLSLIERVWKFFKKKVLANHYQKKFDDFLEAVHDFFKNWDRYTSDLGTLLTLDFEIID
jgi:transposase